MILDHYLDATAIYSTWCVTEGGEFQRVAEFTRRRPEILMLVLDKSLEGSCRYSPDELLSIGHKIAACCAVSIIGSALAFGGFFAYTHSRTTPSAARSE